MNDLAREKLVHAALNGQRQIREMYDDGAGGKCALGVLGYTEWWDQYLRLCSKYGMSRDSQECWICKKRVLSEPALIVHLNDVHELDFLTIARKMP